MGFLAPEHQRWIIEPLVEAGLQLEDITALVFRLAFEGVVGEGTVGDLCNPVSDQPPHVREAWRRAVGRMMASQETSV